MHKYTFASIHRHTHTHTHTHTDIKPCTQLTATHTGLYSHSNTQIIHLLKHLQLKSLNCLGAYFTEHSCIFIFYSKETMKKQWQ